MEGATQEEIKEAQRLAVERVVKEKMNFNYEMPTLPQEDSDL